MSFKYMIYGLRDPRTAEIRYVGQSSVGMSRPRTHGMASNLKKGRYVSSWINKLKSVGLTYEIVILQKLDIGDLDRSERLRLLNEAEKFWCAIGRESLGRRFTNLTEGGDGVLGFKQTPAQIEAQRAFARTPRGRELTAARVARLRAPDVRATISKTRKESTACIEQFDIAREKAYTPESRQKMSVARKTYLSTPDGFAQHSEIIKKAHSPEARIKSSNTRREQTATPEGRAQIIAAQALARTPEARAKAVASLQVYASSPDGYAKIMLAQAKAVEKARTPEVIARAAETRRIKIATDPEYKSTIISNLGVNATRGYSPPRDLVERRAASNRGRKRTPEQCARIRAGRKSKKETQHRCSKCNMPGHNSRSCGREPKK